MRKKEAKHGFVYLCESTKSELLPGPGQNGYRVGP
jgi:hypothetical protein